MLGVLVLHAIDQVAHHGGAIGLLHDHHGRVS
jgi:hypothetical protein